MQAYQRFCALFTVWVTLFDLVSSSQSCSGNGLVYADTNECNCFDCWEGDSCENQITPCTLEDGGGNPLLFQDYWENDPNYFSTNIPTDYRTGYQEQTVIAGPGVTPQGVAVDLSQVIINLHKQVGNAEASGKYIVLGHGCTELIAAISYAFWKKSGQTVNLFAQTPYYDGYAGWGQAFVGQTPFSASYDLDPNTTLEFVTHPNNPTGAPRQPHYKNALQAWDMVYYWPSLVDTNVTMDADVMMFSMSKLSGHAGTRLGWALVKDHTIAQYMAEWVGHANIHVGIDAQYRSLNILRRILASKGGFFKSIKAALAPRWADAVALFNKSKKFSLESRPGTFYMWIRCHDTSKPCYDQFRQHHIDGIPGTAFGADDGHVRLEMVLRDSTWERFYSTLKSFV